MSHILVFNHHSLPFASPQEADAAMLAFLKICTKAQSVGLRTLLLDESVDKNWFRLSLASDYFWQDWYQKHNSAENKDLIRSFRSIVTRQPLFSDADIGVGLDLLCEVLLNGDNRYCALHAAACNNAPAVSFPSCSPWDQSPLKVIVRHLSTNLEFSEKEQLVLNIYSLQVFEKLKPQFVAHRNSQLRSGQEIFAQRNQLFPNLELCGKGPEQLTGWSASSAVLNQVKDSLTILDRFSEGWKAGTIEAYTDGALRDLGLNHQVSGESETVLSNPKLRAQREFYLPTGSKRVFERHIKLSGGLRIHFFPDADSKKVFVGYIGRHLETD